MNRSSDERDHLKVLREALALNREAMYLYNVDFFHWVNTKAQLLLREIEDVAHEAEEKQHQKNERYRDLIHGERSVDDEG